MLSNKEDEKWMKYALNEAHLAFDRGEVPIGAIIVNNNRIIGKGFNQVESLRDATAHAEIIALTSASNKLQSWRLNDCTLYVTKEPCPMCAGAIVNARISKVVYGISDERAGCCGSLYQICRDPRFNHQSVVVGGVLAEDCQFVLKEFFVLKRNKN